MRVRGQEVVKTACSLLHKLKTMLPASSSSSSSPSSSSSSPTIFFLFFFMKKHVK